MEALSYYFLKVRWKLALYLMNFKHTQRLGLKMLSKEEAGILYNMLLDELYQTHREYKNQIEKVISQVLDKTKSQKLKLGIQEDNDKPNHPNP